MAFFLGHSGLLKGIVLQGFDKVVQEEGETGLSTPNPTVKVRPRRISTLSFRRAREAFPHAKSPLSTSS